MAKAYQVVVTQRAQDSFEAIINYLRENASDQTAEKVRDTIEEALEKIGKMPTANALLKGTDNSFLVYRRV